MNARLGRFGRRAVLAGLFGEPSNCLLVNAAAMASSFSGPPSLLNPMCEMPAGEVRAEHHACVGVGLA